MSMRIIKTAIMAEQAYELHEARLLLLLRHCRGRGDGSIDGITKLAKLDFLLRYPLYLERVLEKTGRKNTSVEMHDFEEDTVESKMIRFRYGPWDPRYRKWIGLLVSKGLAETYLKGKTVYVKLTEPGAHLAEKLSEYDDLSDMDRRCKLISKSVGAKSGTWLKDTIYDVVPELSDLPWGEEIR